MTVAPVNEALPLYAKVMPEVGFAILACDSVVLYDESASVRAIVTGFPPAST